MLQWHDQLLQLIMSMFILMNRTEIISSELNIIFGDTSYKFFNLV